MASSQQRQGGAGESIRSCSVTFIKTNNEGVFFLQQSRFEEAIGCFGTVLRSLNSVLSSHTFSGEPRDAGHVFDCETMETTDRRDAPQDSSAFFSQCGEKEASTTAATATTGGPENGYSSNKCPSTTQKHYRPPTVEDHIPLFQKHTNLIYKSPISLFKFLRRPLVSYINFVEMSISVMFNFALAHHLYAVSGQCQDSEKVMDQAVVLYELTHTLQLQEGIELSLEYTMGTICNLGHIHELRGDTEKSSKCFQHLLSIFCFLQSQNSIEVGNPNSADGTGDIEMDDVESNDRLSPASLCLKRLLKSDVLFQSVSHLLLSPETAAAA